MRKSMNVPVSCEGYVRVAYKGETIEIAADTQYQINAGGWLAGPATLVGEVDVNVDDTVYVQGSALLPNTQDELFVHFLIDIDGDTVPDPLDPTNTVFVQEDFGMMCGTVGDHPFWLGNQVVPADYPLTCDPTLGDISMDILLEALARTCDADVDNDGDEFDDDVECHVDTDPLDDCPERTGTPGRCPGADCDGHDAWPPDLDVNMNVNILDVLQYKPALAGPYDARFDLNADIVVNILDVLMYKPVLNTSCTNP